MQYTIYFNQKRLVLSDSKSSVAAHLQQPGTMYQDELSDGAIENTIKEMQMGKSAGAVFIHNPVEALLHGFKKKMTVVAAGGGLVHTNTGNVLLIFRRGKWDLPKGKVDNGETIAAAALREVEEETGLQRLQLEEPLTITYHTYYENGVLILKESHWFLMATEEQQSLVPQTEEDIEECIWVPLDTLTPYLENTHPSIIDVLQSGKRVLHTRKNV